MEAAEAAYRRAVEVSPQHATALYKLGTLLVARGAADDAVAHFERALAARPDYVEAHQYLGVVHQQAGRMDRALKAYREAVRLAPDDPAALFNLAAAMVQAGTPCEARPFLSRCTASSGPSGEETGRERCRSLLAQLESACGA
jgi:Flp pilus assembly protein TadD